MKKPRRILLAAVVALLFPMQSWAGPVNVNQADAQTISAELKGIGLKKAHAIVKYREKNGPFRSAADLSEVKGIGARTVEINIDNILLNDSASAPN